MQINKQQIQINKHYQYAINVVHELFTYVSTHTLIFILSLSPSLLPLIDNNKKYVISQLHFNFNATLGWQLELISHHNTYTRPAVCRECVVPANTLQLLIIYINVEKSSRTANLFNAARAFACFCTFLLYIQLRLFIY